jgi:anthranilate phosphoribosyltransferase
VHGDGGLDEIALSGPSLVAEWTGSEITEYEIHPEEYGFGLRPVSDLAGGDSSENARIVRQVLGGDKGAHRDVVLLNAGFALAIAGVSQDMRSGIASAAASIDSGAAQAKLATLVQATNR